MKSEYQFAVEFKIVQTATHFVEVKAWSSKELDGDNKWHWNVYAYVYETHPWFCNPDVLQSNLPLHYGSSLSQLVSIKPALGIRYDWEKETRTLKFGSDYNHCTDSEHHQSPLEGIPYYVERDALELAVWLEERASMAVDNELEEGTQ